MRPLFTLEEKIEVVEDLIGSMTWTRASPGTRSHVTFLVLKAIAADLRARLSGASGATREALLRRITAVEKRKADGRHEQGAIAGLGEEVIGRWPVIEAALERFGESQ